ncbi:MAG: hydroxymethylbilane synthase [Candidatus Methylopumilus sp.]|jgi:hydroxymethylbilane synthase|nr:hydroxymethylbilane synthase [Candidatus Methylopumilus sp.]NBW60527.1 hydroxymethylbilane synthase [Methylophilaceae bacterium]
MNNPPSKLVIASRESALAMWQAKHIQQSLQALYPNCDIEILGMTTTGDQILDAPLAQIGGKGLFIKELETALLDGRADLAVHSMKDVPMNLPDEFLLAAVSKREDARDAFVSNRYQKIEDLPAGSIVGTSSLRRQSQLKARFPHLKVETLRGNLQTRLRKLDEGQYDGIILAAAGLIRLQLGDRIRQLISTDDSIPAVGQGALGIEINAQRQDLLEVLAPLNDATTHACVAAERAFSRALAGSCTVPLGAYANSADAQTIHIQGFVAALDGSTVLKNQLVGQLSQAEQLGASLAQALIAQGAREVLNDYQ